MQLWPFISHSGFLLESRFSDFFKFAIFSTKISLFLQIHFNLLEDKHSFGYFWTPKSTYDICSVFLYMLSYTLSPKNSKIEILFCQTLRPECTGMLDNNRNFNIYRITKISRNFDDYSDFQQKARGCNNMRHTVNEKKT